MDFERIKLLYHKIRFMCIVDGCKRAEYLRKHNLLKEIGENCLFQSRNFPMDPKLVKIHNNVTIAANVTLCTHDALRHVLHGIDGNTYLPHVGCIEIEENVFVGIGSIILPNVHIGRNCLIAAGSLVTKDVPSGEVWGGVPAKKIGNFEDLHKKRMQEAVGKKEKEQTELEEDAWEEFDRARNR